MIASGRFTRLWNVWGRGGWLLLLALGCLLPAGRAEAVTLTLTLGSSTLTFPNANPGTTSQIAATQNPTSMLILYIGGSLNWSLTVRANGDLVSGPSTIPISNVSWTTTGGGFQSGTLSKTQSRTVATGTLGGLGSISYFLANSWDYPTGSYSQTITYTITEF